MSAVGAYYTGDGIAGKSTRFENFTIRSLKSVFGPDSSSIEHDPDYGFIDEYDSYVWLTDGVIEARFFNPYSAQDGDWTSGFLLRDTTAFTWWVSLALANGFTICAWATPDLTSLIVSEASRVQLPLQHTPLATCLSTSCGV